MDSGAILARKRWQGLLLKSGQKKGIRGGGRVTSSFGNTIPKFGSSRRASAFSDKNSKFGTSRSVVREEGGWLKGKVFLEIALAALSCVLNRVHSRRWGQTLRISCTNVCLAK